MPTSQPSTVSTSINDKASAKEIQVEDREQTKDSSSNSRLVNLLVLSCRFWVLIATAVFNMAYISNMAEANDEFDSSDPTARVALWLWILSVWLLCISKTHSRVNIFKGKLGIFMGIMMLASWIPITIIVFHTITQSNHAYHCHVEFYWSIVSVSLMEYVYFIVDVIMFFKYVPTRFRSIMIVTSADFDFLKTRLSTSSNTDQQQNIPQQVAGADV